MYNKLFILEETGKNVEIYLQIWTKSLHSLMIEQNQLWPYLYMSNDIPSQIRITFPCFADKISFIPAKDRANPYQMEIVFRLFANSVTKITYSFERAFLKWTEYPPDANHGFYVSSAVVSTVLPVASQYTATSQSVSRMEER